ncbi:MAG: NAD(P)H-hydrate dehydratase [Patescibacteria group bacterium]
MPNKVIYQTKPLYPKLLWQRPVHFYKAEAGKVLVIAGSKNMVGAAILTCEAVFRSGTGILLLGFPQGLKDVYKNILPEAMTLPLPETPGLTLSQKAKEEIIDQAKPCDVVIIGPGLSQNAETIQLVWELVFAIHRPIVLDADGLTALARGIEVIKSKENNRFLIDYFKKKDSKLVMTPHPGETYRLIQAIKPEELKDIKITTDYIEKHKESIAPIISHYLNGVVVLKGHDTVICEADSKIVVNKVGGPELATAGSGDVLSGIVGSFVGQNPNQIFEACCTAVYLHGMSGQLAKEKVGERSVIASDIIRFLPEAIKKAEKDI